MTMHFMAIDRATRDFIKHLHKEYLEGRITASEGKARLMKDFDSMYFSDFLSLYDLEEVTN